MSLQQRIERVANKTLRNILEDLRALTEQTFSVPDATGSVKGIIKLSGVLSGTADNVTLRDDSVTTNSILNNSVTVQKLPSGATSTTYLRGDGTWDTPNNTSYTQGTGISISGGVITNTAPNIVQTLSQNGNTVSLSNGGGSATFTYTDTVTRLRGTAGGTFVSGDVTFASGSNVTVSQSGNTITISSGINTYTNGTNMSLTGNTFSVANSPSFSGSVTATSFFESSRREFKTNIKPFTESGLDLINKLSIVTFDRTDNDIKNKIGIIIDDTPKEFASQSGNEVDLYKTIFILAKAVQELNQKLERLDNGANRQNQ